MTLEQVLITDILLVVIFLVIVFLIQEEPFSLDGGKRNDELLPPALLAAECSNRTAGILAGILLQIQAAERLAKAKTESVNLTREVAAAERRQFLEENEELRILCDRVKSQLDAIQTCEMDEHTAQLQVRILLSLPQLQAILNSLPELVNGPAEGSWYRKLSEVTYELMTAYRQNLAPRAAKGEKMARQLQSLLRETNSREQMENEKIRHALEEILEGEQQIGRAILRTMQEEKSGAIA